MHPPSLLARRMLLLAALVVAIPSLVAGQRSIQLEKEIRELENRRFQAMTAVDMTTLDGILAEDLTHTHSTGSVETKAQFLASLQSGQVKYEGIHLNEGTVRAYGNTVVVTGKATMNVAARGQRISFQVRFIAVYVNRDGRWQMVAWQSTRIPEEK